MPRLDGYEVLVELKKCPETAAIPFIFLTARTDETAIRWLTEPFGTTDD